MAHLCETWCSQASAKQRRGRAGRTKEGVCYKLFSRQVHEDVMAPYQLPEIKRVPLEDLMLQILLSGSQPAAFLMKALDPPAPEAVRSAVHNLHELGAIVTTTTTAPDTAAQCELTPLGFHLAHIPVEPRVGKMLIFGCIFGVLPPLLTIAAAWCVSTRTLPIGGRFCFASGWVLIPAA
jgi:ATP-dependent RNA helicase DHX57